MTRKSLSVLTLQQKTRCLELQHIIHANAGLGQFILVAMSLREIDQNDLFLPEKSIYTFAKQCFGFNRRTTNTYLCSASVYVSLMQDKSLPMPANISHIRSLHKYPCDVRRLIWRKVCESKDTITEELVLSMALKYETGSIFADLNNEFYTPVEIIQAAKNVSRIPIFDLDPASCAYANELHLGRLSNVFYTEEMDGLSHPWMGHVWLSPPVGYDSASGIPKQALWFMHAEKKFKSGEIQSCHALLKLDLQSQWLLRAFHYPHCQINVKLQFTLPPSSLSKHHCSDNSYVLVYLGSNVEAFCTEFSRFGIIPGFNSWAFSPSVLHPSQVRPGHPSLGELSAATADSTTAASSDDSPHLYTHQTLSRFIQYSKQLALQKSPAIEETPSVKQQESISLSHEDLLDITHL